MRGPEGPLGQPTSNEVELSDAVGQASTFEHGTIVWTPDAGAHTVSGRIGEEWNKDGAQGGPLGYPVTDEIVNPNTHCVRQVFQGGAYMFSPDAGGRSSGVMAELADSTTSVQDPMAVWGSFPPR
ncbi:LGFP repeat-containing protein [Rhodococcus jostii]|uniref:LGFP repeat-containing protein n=1 Tax=Rhodococcus jostii TaxID=132919 RepID=UPI003639D429